MIALLFFGWLDLARVSPASGTTPFLLDGNRVYAELAFVRPDGSAHRALAFVDMGSPSMEIVAGLQKDLGLERDRSLTFRVGDLTVTVPGKDVSVDPSEPRAMGPELKVEAMLPAGVLQRYEVVLDYRHRTLTLAPPGTVQPEGMPVPFRRNPETGLIAVEGRIGGKAYMMTIDNGSAYTWFRQDTVKDWLSANPGWERAVGAVGPSNMTMAGDDSEASGVLARIPEIAIDPVRLKHVGVLGAGRGKGPGGVDLFDWYSSKNPVPVIGWIGGNVLRAFRLTIDYANRTIYWLRQDATDASELDQVGLTLRRRTGEYFVAAIATKKGKPTVEGVQIGDKLIQIDGLETKGATLGRIYDALAGKPGDVRALTLERDGARLVVHAAVTAF